MLIIKKFGGTSVGDVERIHNVAKIIFESIKLGNKIIILVSAMANMTNDIYSKLCSISKNTKNTREFDQAMVTGEQISASLLTIALCELGLKARSYNAQSLGIYGDGEYSDGYITHVEVGKLKKDLENEIVPVITGFQGFKKQDNSFITLGRGGSDYSAVMIAAAIHADSCYIYTDVDGVYSADPRIVKNAIKIEELNYDEIIEMASDGAKVLQAKSVIAGKKYNISIKVLSSFEINNGTKITNNAFLQKKSNLKTISNNSNLLLIKKESLENCDGKNDELINFSEKFYAINNNVAHYFFDVEKIAISKISIMSLNKSEILNLLDIKSLLDKLKINPISLELKNKKIVLIVALKDSEKAITAIHKFYNENN